MLNKISPYMNKRIQSYHSVAADSRRSFLRKGHTLVMIIWLFYMPAAFAQTSDSLQLFREFIAVSNSYKQLPLQMSMNFTQYANYPKAANDTGTTTHGEFYINSGGAYISFGRVEQVVNDSLVLVIMKDIKQMTLSANSTPVSAWLNAMIAQPLQDTSALKFAAVYTVKMNKAAGGANEITIASRELLEGAGLPLVGISVLYNTSSKLPEKVVTVRRGLTKIPAGGDKDNANKTAVVTRPEKTITIAGKGDFIVKEERAEIVYNKITHAENVQLPVTITDRVVQVHEKNFEPVKAYQNYHLSQDIQN